MEMQCLRLQADRNGRGVRELKNGTQRTAGPKQTPVFQSREHPARSCPNVGVSTHSIFPPPRRRTQAAGQAGFRPPTSKSRKDLHF